MIISRILHVTLLALILPAASCRQDAEKDAVMLDIRDLQSAVARYESENRRMWGEIASTVGSEPYIVIDTAANKLYLREGERLILEATASTGSGRMLEETGGRKWIFNTPKGMFSILDKVKDPVWYKPDWAFVEDNLPIPPPDSTERVVRGMLGKYGLDLGGGYKIHGTPYRRLLGRSVSHGCVRLGDDDIERLYNMVNVGTKVYIY